MFAAACAAFLEASITSMKREQASALQIAKLAEATGDHKRMRTALVQILRADSRNIPARLQMAEHHIAQGNLTAAANFEAACAALSELEATAGDGSTLPGGAANPPSGARARAPVARPMPPRRERLEWPPEPPPSRAPMPFDVCRGVTARFMTGRDGRSIPTW